MIIFTLNDYNFYLNQNKNISSKLIDDYFLATYDHLYSIYVARRIFVECAIAVLFLNFISTYQISKMYFFYGNIRFKYLTKNSTAAPPIVKQAFHLLTSPQLIHDARLR